VSDVSFILKDSRSGHILISEMIASESRKAILPLLKIAGFKFGIPLASISDLKPGFKSISEEAFDKKAPHKFCDYHFLRTFKADFTGEHAFIKSRLTKSWQIKVGLEALLKTANQATDEQKRSPYKKLKDIEQYWEHTHCVLETYCRTLDWILNFKKASSGKGVPFDLPYLDLYERLVRGKKLIDKIFVDVALNEHYVKFTASIDRMNNCSHWGTEFRQNISFLRYARKWFTKLRGALMMGTLQEAKDPLAPLSKQYKLTVEEAKAIPGNIEKYLTQIQSEIASCKDPKRLNILKRFHSQTDKYKENLKLPVLLITILGTITTFIPTRTNNSLESFFRLIKVIIRRTTGRSKLTKEFGSVGALLPFYVYMKDHPTFKEIFDNEQRIINEFSTLVNEKGQPGNIVKLDYAEQNRYCENLPTAATSLG